MTTHSSYRRRKRFLWSSKAVRQVASCVKHDFRAAHRGPAMTTIPADFAGNGLERNHSVLFGIGEPTLAHRERQCIGGGEC